MIYGKLLPILTVVLILYRVYQGTPKSEIQPVKYSQRYNYFVDEEEENKIMNVKIMKNYEIFEDEEEEIKTISEDLSDTLTDVGLMILDD